MSPTSPESQESKADVAYLDNLSEDQLDELKRTLRQVIDRRIEGIHYSESRRAAFATVGTAIFAASFALFAVVAYVAYRPLQLALAVLGVGTVFLGLLVLVIYSLQTNFPYPFKPATKAWKWFYRDALPDHRVFKAPWYARLNRRDADDQRRAYDAQLTEFKGTQVRLVDPKVDVDQDIQQLFLLHVNERYKNLFLTQLREVVYWGVVIAGLTFSAVLLALVALSEVGWNL